MPAALAQAGQDSTVLLRNKMELFGPFRPGGTGEGSQVVYGLGL